MKDTAFDNELLNLFVFELDRYPRHPDIIFNNFDKNIVLPIVYRMQVEGIVKIVTYDEQGTPIRLCLTEKGLDVKYQYGSYENWKRSQRMLKVAAGIVRAALIGGIVFIVCWILMK